MIVQLRGAGFSNKGAELMLLSSVRWLEENHPESQPALHYAIGESAQRRALGLKDIVWQEHHRSTMAKQLINALVQANWRRGTRVLGSTESPETAAAGFWHRASRRLETVRRARGEFAVPGGRVDVVLDLSGFAYGDPWGTREAVVSASYYEEIRRRGGRVVLMPQQLGPFERPDVRESFRQLSMHCDLIFARDEVSFHAASSVVADRAVLRQAPDFTILQAGVAPDDGRFSNRACIVPNFKMIEQRSDGDRQAYPEFLRRCVQALRARDVPVFVLLHEYSGRDHEVADQLAAAVGGIEIMAEPDPLRLKGILGASRITIGSRFHGLVSALSQAVPSLATSWSHKYELLFEEYGCPECLVAPTNSDAELEAALVRVLNEPSRSELVATLRTRNAEQKERALQMWREVHELLALPVTQPVHA